MNKLFFLLFICQLTFAQTAGEKILHGKIIVESRSTAGVTVINLINEKTTVSDSNGEFYILAKAEDLLVFSSVNLEYHRKIIDEDDLKLDVLIVKMIAKVTELKEVIVNNNPDINAVSLGISPKGIKKYSPAERRLKTATSLNATATVGNMAGGSMSLDPLLNYLSGRTEMLKKELEVEKKERLLIIFEALYKEDYFHKVLKISTDYIKGFQYYCIEDPSFAEVLKTKNKTKIELLMIPLAIKYNEIIFDEN